MTMTGAPPSTFREVDGAREQGVSPGRQTPTGGSGTGGRLPPEVYRRRRLVLTGGLLALLVVGLFVVTRDGDPATEPIEPAATATPTAPPATTPLTSAPAEASAIVADFEPTGCMLDVTDVKFGDTGESVECVQTALQAAGAYDGDITGVFDQVTDEAAKLFQTELGLYVDGIVGANTATELGIWPGADAFIVRTPPPAAGATDLWGLPLSSVASAGSDAPPLPDDAGQGTGKRVVYDRASQRVWAIDDEERIVRSYLVSGSQYRNEVAGTHKVYSKSEVATGWNLTANLPYMVRYYETERGHIGFHAIPYWKDSGEHLQTEAELGQKLSGGCQRQALLDAQFMYQFANIGTTVIVL
jgi:hypothetical protein